MPMHNWSRVPAGIFQAFHNTWIGDLQKALNDHRLPQEYYALGEQRAGDIGPDVLTLHSEDEPSQEDVFSRPNDDVNGGMVAVAEAPPRVSLTQDAEDLAFYLARQKNVVIRCGVPSGSVCSRVAASALRTSRIHAVCGDGRRQSGFPS